MISIDFTCKISGLIPCSLLSKRSQVKSWAYGYGFSYVYRRQCGLDLPENPGNPGSWGMLSVGLFKMLKAPKMSSNRFIKHEMLSEAWWFDFLQQEVVARTATANWQGSIGNIDTLMLHWYCIFLCYLVLHQPLGQPCRWYGNINLGEEWQPIWTERWDVSIIKDN